MSAYQDHQEIQHLPTDPENFTHVSSTAMEGLKWIGLQSFQTPIDCEVSWFSGEAVAPAPYSIVHQNVRLPGVCREAQPWDILVVLHDTRT